MGRESTGSSALVSSGTEPLTDRVEVFPARLTSLLSIAHPIIQGGMTWVSRAELAAAVCEAGALGVIGSGGMEPEELREQIRKLRTNTARTFAVNVPLVSFRPDGDDDLVARLIEVVIEEEVPVVVTGAGSPRRFTADLHAAGARVLHVVPSVGLALKCEAAGVDAVVAESAEAGGHIRADGLSSFALIPQVADALSIPVIAAGGIADARGVAAALVLGADGVQLGTRFIATRECNAHDAFKQALLEASAEGTLVYCRDYHASRALATPAVKRLVEMEQDGHTTRELMQFRGRGRARGGCIEGDIETGILPAGAAAGLVRRVQTVAEVVEELTQGARAILESLDGAGPARGGRGRPRAA